MDNSRIKNYLNSRGISDAVISHRKLSWNGKKIVIPIFDIYGNFLFNKYRKDPNSKDMHEPKYSYDPGGRATLYCLDLIGNRDNIIICEGEFDALILWSKGFSAVTSTGGAGTFDPAWAWFFEKKNVYICFDNDVAGRKGSVRLSTLIPHAYCLPLPADVKDITDYFIKRNNTAEDFLRLMTDGAFKLDIPVAPVKPPRPTTAGTTDFARAKTYPISDFLKVDASGFASCPFHHEKTASLKVDKNNRFYCFGCGKWGDVIDIVQHMNGFAKPMEAVKFILKK